MRALWGATPLSRAKEIIFSVVSKGHYVSPVMHTRYERLLWLARVAWRPGVPKVFTQAIRESGGPVGRALHTAATHVRAGGAGTFRGKSTLFILCRSPNTRSRTDCATAFTAVPRACWRRGARLPSGGWAMGQMARRAARPCASPPLVWRSGCCAASWPEPYGRWPGCSATARGPTPRACTAARRTRMRSMCCGTARSGRRRGGHGVPS